MVPKNYIKRYGKKTINISSFVFISLLLSTSLRAQTVPQNVDMLFSILHNNGDFNGQVLVAENGLSIYERSFGFANFENQQSLTINTSFELASVAKQFTALAIMQLIEKKKLAYSTQLNTLFAELKFEKVTVEDLLRHTSGIPDFMNWGRDKIDVNRINTNKDILEALIKHVKTPLFKPGDKISYSNTNYVLLALIIEKVSGLSYAKYINQKICNPIGMQNTRVCTPLSAEKSIEDFARGYVYDPKTAGFIPTDSTKGSKYFYYFDGVAGPYGIRSTVKDLLLWDNALNTSKLLNCKAMQAAFEPTKLNDRSIGKVEGLPYGMGWMIAPTSKLHGRKYFHSGNFPGFATMIVRYPDAKKTIIVLTNQTNNVNIYELTWAIEDIIFKTDFSIPRKRKTEKSIELTESELEALTGIYIFRNLPSVKLSITTLDGRLYAQIDRELQVEIFPESSTTFFYSGIGIKIIFSKNAMGVTQKLTFYQGDSIVEEAVKQ
jgi:CubicO group peptidase (beta-lactamase class C family)